MKKPLVFHPLLLAFFPPLSLMAHGISYMFLSLRELLVPLALAVGLAALLLALLTLLLKDAPKAGIITSVLLLLFFSYGHLFTQFAAWGLPIPHGYLLAGMGLVFAALAALLVRTRMPLRTLTILFNIAAAALVVVPVAMIALYLLSSRAIAVARPEPVARSAPAARPDIYYLIVDGYGRADILAELYAIDNSAFVAGLEERGFYVAAQSRANYTHTHLSLASALNMIYLDEVADQVGRDSTNRMPLRELIADSVVFRFAREQGYQLVAYSSGSAGTSVEKADSYRVAPWTVSEYQSVLVNTTPLSAVLGGWQYDRHRARIRYILDDLATIPAIAEPTLTFAHILAPHPPFVFGANGEPVQSSRDFALFDGSQYMALAPREEYVERYAQQVTYISRELLKTIDQILAASTEPPILIIQGDHGPGSQFDWESLENSYLPERFSILNAYYLPDGGAEALYAGITPVNTFRLVFNRYLGTDLELLEDRSYYATMSRPFSFVDVTAQLTAP